MRIPLFGSPLGGQYIYIYIYAYVCVYIYICMYVYIYIYIYAYIYIYIHIHTYVHDIISSMMHVMACVVIISMIMNVSVLS